MGFSRLRPLAAQRHEQVLEVFVKGDVPARLGPRTRRGTSTEPRGGNGSERTEDRASCLPSPLTLHYAVLIHR